MTNHTFRRASALFLALILVFSALTVAVFSASDLPEANSKARHALCTELSDAAKAYYAGEYSYDNLLTLDGADDISDSAAAARDNELYSALNALMTDTHSYFTSYSGYKKGSLAYYWVSTDAVSGSATYVMFYSDIMADAEGVKLNREHIWPKSRASYNTKYGGADLHHLRPSVDSVNSAKSDHAFGFVDGTFESGVTSGGVGGESLYYLCKSEDLFECKDDVKGDVARILLYVYCRWGQPNLYSDVTEGLPTPDEDDASNSGKKVIESLDTLLLWCEFDPVDEWEMERNDLTEKVQGNRNVFIDYPELAWRMFGLDAPAGMATPTEAGCDHEFAESARRPATCVADGSYTVRCPLCGNERTRRLAATGHTDENGDGVCDRCGVGPDGKCAEHVWDVGKVSVAPGCETSGTAIYTCTRCGETREGAIPAKGHVPGIGAIENVTAPTDGAKGSFDDVSYCSVCKKELSRRTLTYTVTSGDANRDGSLNARDVVAVMRYLVGWEDADFAPDRADMSSDGRISAKDVLLIMRFIAAVT